jgi:ferric-dicitrate binding protein FerR (iron transport regulator)
LILPDGTQVWLNGNSHLSYDAGGFGSLKREVQLTGEAFFDVVKNENLPFIIHTKLVDIRVKGTAFNVKAYPGEKTMETALVRGLVEVTTKQDPDRRILLKPNEKIVVSLESIQENLKKGESQQPKTDAVYAITTLRKNQSDKIAETVWMQTRLVFDNESFRDLGPKLQEWFNIKIKLADENIGNKRFSGVIEKETLTETLEAMQLSFPFTYQFKQGELEISSK